MIRTVKVDRDQRYLTLGLTTGQSYSYPWIWLRDNCRCEDCIFPVTEARKTQIKDLDLESKISSAKASSNGNEVTVRWTDDHLSVFPFDWLKYNRFTEDGIKERKHNCRLTPEIWGKGHELFKVDFNQFMTDDRATYKCLVSGEQSGVFLLQNAPSEGSALKMIADRVHSWLRPQHHGENFENREIFNIRTDMIQTSDVYTSGRLNYHTDLTYCKFPPGLQILHCVQQTPTKGGDSIFSDGFKAARIMQDEYPDLYDILTKVPVSSNDFGGYYYDFDMVAYTPTIILGIDGDLDGVSFANHARYSHLHCPLDEVEKWYKAYQIFEGLLEEHHLEYRLKAGDVVCFDNHRILHGRLGFEMTCGSRHLKGSYIEWDDLWSERRALQHRLKETPP